MFSTLETRMNRQHRPPFNRTLYIGLILMIVANVARMVLERHTSMPEGPRDGVLGVLFGLAIGSVLLGVWRMRRASNC
jgi:hypothetical protein